MVVTVHASRDALLTEFRMLSRRLALHAEGSTLTMAGIYPRA